MTHCWTTLDNPVASFHLQSGSFALDGNLVKSYLYLFDTLRKRTGLGLIYAEVIPPRCVGLKL